MNRPEPTNRSYVYEFRYFKPPSGERFWVESHRDCVPGDEVRRCDCNYRKGHCHCTDSDSDGGEMHSVGCVCRPERTST